MTFFLLVPNIYMIIISINIRILGFVCILTDYYFTKLYCFALYSSKLIGQGPGKSSSHQNSCLADWLSSTPSVIVSDDLTPVVSVACLYIDCSMSSTRHASYLCMLALFLILHN